MSRDRAPEVGGTSWSFADQGVVSAGNFLTQIILVRSLTPSEYGIFVLLYSVMLLLNNCHTAVVTYPLSVQGAASDLSCLRKLTAFSLGFTVAAAIPQAIVVFGVAIFLKHTAVALVMVIALACWQLQETLRRGLMAHLRHRRAIPGDTLSYCGQAVTLWFLARQGAPSLRTVFWVIAGTSVLAAFLQACQLRPTVPAVRETLALVRPYWRLGRWNLATNATDTVTTVCFPWMLDLAQGPHNAALYQAVSNLLRVSNPVAFGVSNLVVPAASRAKRDGSIRRAGRTALRSGALGAMLLIPYFGLLLLWPHWALSMAYGHNSAYVELVAPLRWFVVAFVFSYLFVVLGAFLNGIKHPSTLFAAEMAGAVCVVIAGIPLTLRYAVVGACIGFCLVTLARAASSSVLIRRLVRSTDAALGPTNPGAER